MTSRGEKIVSIVEDQSNAILSRELRSVRLISLHLYRALYRIQFSVPRIITPDAAAALREYEEYIQGVELGEG